MLESHNIGLVPVQNKHVVVVVVTESSNVDREILALEVQSIYDVLLGVGRVELHRVGARLFEI